MSDTSQGPGWWRASDGRWYPPEQHPDARALAGATNPSPDARTAANDQPANDQSAHGAQAQGAQVAGSAPTSQPHPTAGPLPADGSPTQKRGRTAWFVAAALLVVVALLGGGLILVSRDTGPSDTAAAAADPVETTTTSPEPVALTLEAIGVSGPDPFTDSVAIGEVAVQTSVQGGEDGEGERAVDGTAPGLYGGTGTEACDTVALVAFLRDNPGKAAAWAGVFGIAPEGIADYVAGLTAVLLRVDTRVTNHGFVEGQPQATEYQAVLQAGTAVLVDGSGVPRVKCNCGNPLSEPAALPTPLPEAEEAGVLETAGDPWPGWTPAEVVTVDPGPAAVTTFVLVNVETGFEYNSEVGSQVTTTTTAPPTTRPPTTRPPTTAPPTTPPTSECDPCGGPACLLAPPRRPGPAATC